MRKKTKNKQTNKTNSREQIEIHKEQKKTTKFILKLNVFISNAFYLCKQE